MSLDNESREAMIAYRQEKASNTFYHLFRCFAAYV
jgi:hypothetical protein